MPRTNTLAYFIRIINYEEKKYYYIGTSISIAHIVVLLKVAWTHLAVTSTLAHFAIASLAKKIFCTNTLAYFAIASLAKKSFRYKHTSLFLSEQHWRRKKFYNNDKSKSITYSFLSSLKKTCQGETHQLIFARVSVTNQ